MQESLAAIQAAIGHSHVGGAVAGVVWVKALLESAHILAMGFVLFAVGMICLRLAGLAGRSDSLIDRVRRFSPWLWGALIVVFVTGFLLLTGAGSRRGLPSPMFQLKMALMIASIAVTALLQLTTQSDHAFWELNPARRIAAGLLAPACLLLWMATVCAGRWLAYAYVLFPDA